MSKQDASSSSMMSGHTTIPAAEGGSSSSAVLPVSVAAPDGAHTPPPSLSLLSVNKAKEKDAKILEKLRAAYVDIHDIDISAIEEEVQQVSCNRTNSMGKSSNSSDEVSRLRSICGVPITELPVKVLMKFCAVASIKGYKNKTRKQICDIIVAHKVVKCNLLPKSLPPNVPVVDTEALSVVHRSTTTTGIQRKNAHSRLAKKTGSSLKAKKQNDGISSATTTASMNVATATAIASPDQVRNAFLTKQALLSEYNEAEELIMELYAKQRALKKELRSAKDQDSQTSEVPLIEMAMQRLEDRVTFLNETSQLALNKLKAGQLAEKQQQQQQQAVLFTTVSTPLVPMGKSILDDDCSDDDEVML
jgi:hypothetical protein